MKLHSPSKNAFTLLMPLLLNTHMVSADTASSTAEESPFASSTNIGTEDFDYSLFTLTGDMDNDGDLDVVTGNSGNGNIVSRLYLNDGEGNYSNSVDIVDDAAVFAIADLDNDGDIDLLSISEELTLHLNDGQNSFSQTTTLNTSAGIYDRLHIADVDNDKDIDVIYAPFYSARILYRNNGTGEFVQEILSNNAAWTKDIAFGDLDADGDLDLIIGNFNNADMIYLNKGDGTFEDGYIVVDSEDEQGTESYGVDAQDIDNDGDLDLVIARPTSTTDNTRVSASYINDGTGQFTVGQDLTDALNAVDEVDKNIQDISMADIDDDGNIDAIIGVFDAPNRLLLNNGDGTFDTAILISDEADETLNVVTADVNGDGYADVLVGNGIPENKLYLNTTQPDSDTNNKDEDSTGIGNSNILTLIMLILLSGCRIRLSHTQNLFRRKN